MITSNQITQEGLTLVVSEKSLGSLVTNAKDIREMVLLGLNRYDISNYNSDNIADAKKDKAMLNAAAKQLNDKRIEYEKEFMKPFAEFKDIVSETTTLIKQASFKIDEVVKQSEDKAKADKLAEVEIRFNSLDFPIGVNLPQILNEKWLNKTTSIKTVEGDLISRLDDIKSDIGQIETMQILQDFTDEQISIAKSYYFQRLQVSDAVLHLTRIAEAKKEARAKEEALKVQNTAPRTECIPQVYVAQQADIYENRDTVTREEAELLTRAFKVKATRENIIALGEFMNMRGIYFEKLEI